jgi:hypothetical protein
VLAGRIPQRRVALSSLAAVLALATTSAGVIAEQWVSSDRVGERAIDGPAAITGGAEEHPVWRLEQMAGHSLDVLVERGLSLSDAARRSLTQRVERTADRVAPFDWRAQGVSLEVGCHPVGDVPCPLGVAIPDGARTRIVLSPLVAYLTDDALATVVAHELAHVWHFALMPARRPGSALVDLEVERPDGTDPAELEADCLAAAWGHAPPEGAELGYWQCPEPARLAAGAAWRAAPLD